MYNNISYCDGETNNSQQVKMEFVIVVNEKGIMTLRQELNIQQ